VNAFGSSSLIFIFLADFSFVEVFFAFSFLSDFFVDFFVDVFFFYVCSVVSFSDFLVVDALALAGVHTQAIATIIATRIPLHL
jgi:hypothetical protein